LDDILGPIGIQSPKNTADPESIVSDAFITEMMLLLIKTERFATD
jgi:hypothetical protein